MQNKTIKFFISSTFKDFESERNILHKFVFPKLKDLCHKNGFGFQPIDLRWGVMPEAGLDQLTMDICLKEIKRSSYEPKPNLLLLVGQRYGWVPLPYQIEKNELEDILKKVSQKDEVLIREWYIEDTNEKETIYYLKDKHGLSRDEWSPIEKQIRKAFQDVTFADSIYHQSATEQEMSDGLDKFKKEIDHSHTFAYFRTITNYDINNEDVKDYIDKDVIESKKLSDKNLTKSGKLLNKLKIKCNIPQDNQITQDQIAWTEIEKIKDVPYEELTLENTPEYLQEFHNEMVEKFTISIQSEIDDYKKNESTQLQIELEQQQNGEVT